MRRDAHVGGIEPLFDALVEDAGLGDPNNTVAALYARRTARLTCYTSAHDDRALEPTDLPPYRHRGPCPRCGGRRPIRVHFDRDCPAARGDHFRRVCPCGHRWIERCSA